MSERAGAAAPGPKRSGGKASPEGAARASEPVSTATIVPDTKDWTWVVLRPCPECGLDTSTFAREEVATLLRANAAEWPEVLSAPGVRDRPRPEVWSPLEYACHVRDVFRIYAQRLDLMLAQDDPSFANWDQDATAVEVRYSEQDPATVAAELVAAGNVLADGFAGVSGEQWQRTGNRSDGAQFTVESFARYFIHDPIHHFYDVTGRRATD